MNSEDPEERIARLERELAEMKRAQSGREIKRGWVNRPAADDLAVPPRRVPTLFLLAELLPFRWWYIWALFMVAIAPIALWISYRSLMAPVAIVTIVVMYAVQLRGTAKRVALLKWGRQATVSGTETLSRGTYYSGTTWSNAPLPIAHGWKVTRPLYSGPSTKTRINYTLDGARGSIVVRGREYIDGVVLADQRNPQHALCVTAFPYDLDRDTDGNWVGKLRPRLVLGMAVWSLILVVWIGGAVAYSNGFTTELFSTNVGPGGSVTVKGTDKRVHCDGGGEVDVEGIDGSITVQGNCTRLSVSGIDNAVVIDSADTITVSGIGNHVTYHSGSPHITRDGMNATVEQG